jgi:hypothetical protein
MVNKLNRPHKAKPGGPAGRRLAPELFTELNATFYQDDPSDYLLTKVEALTLMLAPDEALAPVYASDRRIGVTHLGAMPVPSKESHDRYVRTESVLVLHHACEMVLRLFFAHAEKPDCPWLGMAASVSFAEFKEKVSTALRNGFDRDAVALVFLGGTDLRDAAIRVEDDEFDDDKALKKTGLAPLTIHDLRHTYASLSRRAGADLRLLQKAMGHASITVTAHTYADLYDDELDGIAAALDLLEEG